MKTWYYRNNIHNLLVLEQAGSWFRKGLISSGQYFSIHAASRPAYKRSNFFIRAGMFILTAIAFSGSFGLFGLILNIFDGETGMKVMLLLASALSFFILHMFIREKGHFCTGVDDALLYCGLLLLITFIQLSFNHLNDDFILFLCLSTFPVLLAASVLFIDRLLSLLSFFCLLAIIFILALKTGSIGRMLMPFIVMFFSAGIYLLTRKKSKDDNLVLWNECFSYVSYAAMAVFYLAGNYFVVREGNALLQGATLQEGEDIPMAFIFYAWTFLLPVAYCWAGLKRKEYAFLNAGLLFVFGAVLTLRYYYSVVPLEWALLAGGLILFSGSTWAWYYLKEPKYGITSTEDSYQASLLKLAAESLVIAQTFGHDAVVKKEGTAFGDGEFGGGGAGGKY